jgi:hypothetical protein
MMTQEHNDDITVVNVQCQAARQAAQTTYAKAVAKCEHQALPPQAGALLKRVTSKAEVLTLADAANREVNTLDPLTGYRPDSTWEPQALTTPNTSQQPTADKHSLATRANMRKQCWMHLTSGA